MHTERFAFPRVNQIRDLRAMHGPTDRPRGRFCPGRQEPTVWPGRTGPMLGTIGLNIA